MATQIVTASGRIVWGNPQKPRPITDDNNKPKHKADGSPEQEWAFGLAIPKAHFGDVGAAMEAEARAVCPQGIPGDFAFKMKDGDGLDAKGKSYSTREGYAGCYILAIGSRFAPQVVKRNTQGKFDQLGDGAVKTGDYCRVALTIDGHGAHPGKKGSKPGLYLNPSMVEFLGYGDEIRTGPDPDDVFGEAVAMPAGASATPTASHAMPVASGGLPFATAPAPQASPPAPPVAPPAANNDFPWGKK